MKKDNYLERYHRKVMSGKSIEQINGEEIDNINNKIDFMHIKLLTVIKEEINLSLNKEGFKEFLIKTAQEVVDAQMRNIISEIVNKTIQKLNKNIKMEAEITKSLCYSIDTDVKNAIRNLDCSAQTDIIIENVFKKHLERTTQKLGLEKEETLKIE